MFALEICNVQFSNHGVCVQVNHHILNRFIIVRLNEMFTYMTNLICIFEKKIVKSNLPVLDFKNFPNKVSGTLFLAMEVH